MEKRDMMINKRLINTISESKKYIAANVALQWLSLAANIVMMTAVTWFLAGLFTKEDVYKRQHEYTGPRRRNGYGSRI